MVKPTEEFLNVSFHLAGVDNSRARIDEVKSAKSVIVAFSNGHYVPSLSETLPNPVRHRPLSEDHENRCLEWLILGFHHQ